MEEHRMDLPEGGVGQPTPAAPELNAFEKLFNVLLSPTATFESVRVRPDWWLPLLLITAVSFGMTYVLTERMDMEDFYRGIVERQADAQGWDDARIEEQLEAMEAQAASQGSPLVSLFTTPAFMVIIALVFWGAMRAAGGVNNFTQTMGATFYGWTPLVIKSVLVTLFALRKDSIPFSERSSILVSHLGFLASPADNPVLHSALTWVDVFNIWALVLLSIGLAVVARFSVRKVAIFMVIVYLIAMGIGVGLAALMSSFMG